MKLHSKILQAALESAEQIIADEAQAAAAEEVVVAAPVEVAAEETAPAEAAPAEADVVVAPAADSVIVNVDGSEGESVSQEGALGAAFGAGVGTAFGPLGVVVGAVSGSAIADLVTWGFHKLQSKENQLVREIGKLKVAITENEHQLSETEHEYRTLKTQGKGLDKEKVEVYEADIADQKNEIEGQKKLLTHAEKALSEIRKAKAQAERNKGVVSKEDIGDDEAAAEAPAAEAPAEAAVEAPAEAAAEVPAEAAPITVNVTAGDDAHVDVVPDVSADAEHTESDIAEGEGQVEEADAAVDQLQDAAQSLESLYSAMANAHSNGGMTPEARPMAQVAFESILAPLGLEAEQLPSMESFGGSSSRRVSTESAMDSISNMLARIWEAIKAAVAKAKEFIINLFKRIFSAAERLKQNAKKIKEAAAKASGSAKESEIAVPKSAIKYLAVGNPSRKPEGAVEAMISVVADAGKYDEEAGKGLVANYSAIEEVAKNADLDQGKIVAAMKGLLELHAPVSFKHKSEIKGDDGIVLEQATTDALPGGKRFYVTSLHSSAIEKAVHALTMNPFRVSSYTDEKALAAVKDEMKIATLSGSEIEALADSCEKLADAVLAAKKIAEETADQAKMISKISIKKSGSIAEKGAKWVATKMLMNAFRDRAAACGKASAMVGGHACQVGSSMLTIGQVSLKQYGAETALVAAAA